MKTKLSYKNKRSIIIFTIIVALVVGIAISIYFFVKGNEDQASAYAKNNLPIGERIQVEEIQEKEGGEIQDTEQSLSKGEQQNQDKQQIVSGESSNENEKVTDSSNKNTTTEKNNNNIENNTTTESTKVTVPNEEYVTKRIETEEVLIREDYKVAWQPMNINAETTTTELEIVRPIITAKKQTNRTTVSPGDEIEYTIIVENSGKIAGTTIVKDSAPVEPVKTTFKQDSIKINGENATKTIINEQTGLEEEVSLTEQDLKNGIEIEVPKITENETGKTTISFTVVVDIQKETSKVVEGTVENTAIVDEEETNTVYNSIITYKKEVNKSVVQFKEAMKYTIIVKNIGNVEGTAIISDQAPEETVFVEESITIDGKIATKTITNEQTGLEEEVSLTEQDLKDGIEINVPANKEVKVSFIVKSKDLEDGYIIRNTAKVNNKDTNETETIYQEPIIEAVKSTNKETVIPGDEIVYTITAKNTGSTEGIVTVKDSAPTEPIKTTFKEGSIKINGKTATKKVLDMQTMKEIEVALTERDLIDGIQVKVPGKTEKDIGKTTISFAVTIDKLEEGKRIEGTVQNTAVVDDKNTNTVYNPIITFYKEVDKTKARINDTLKYTITVKNTGSVDATAVVKDEVPNGTTFKEGSIKINGETATKTIEGKEVTLTEQDLKDGINVNVLANEVETKISFEVTVNSNITTSPVTNTAKVNDNNTNEVSTRIYTDYKVEYYYDKSDGNGSKLYEPYTENGEEYKQIEVGKIITDYTDKPSIQKDEILDKYKFEKDNLLNDKLVLVGDPEKNIIKVYYRKPVLEVNKTSDIKKATYDETITYTITVENKTNVDTEITLSDPIPSQINFIEGSITIVNNEGKDLNATYGYDETERKITYKGNLNANKTLTLTFKAKVNEKAYEVIKTGIKNTVYVTEECGGEYQDSALIDIYKGVDVDAIRTIDLILVLDCSNSMEQRDSSGKLTGKLMPELKTAAEGVISKLFEKPTDSTVSLITYGNTATTYGTYSYKNKASLKTTLNNALVLRGNTHIQDALAHTNNLIKNELDDNRRKVVLFMSDGAPTFWSSDADSDEVKIISGSSNTNWPLHSWVKDTFTENTRQNIMSQINTLHSQNKTTVYSVGLNVENLSTKYIQYVEKVGAYKNQTGTGNIFYQGLTTTYNGSNYYYISEKAYATYVLDNISTKGPHISTNDLVTTFNEIINHLTENDKGYITADGTDSVVIPETREITGTISVTINDNTTAYILNQLKAGVDGLVYTENVGFIWTIDKNRFASTLHIRYKVNGE